MIVKKYFFVAFKAANGTRVVGGGSILVVCSCGIKRMDEVLLDYYNKRASFGNMADKLVITSLTVLDKQTAAQLSENFTNALIIDDGEKEEEKQAYIEWWIARDEDGTLCMYWGENPPTKIDKLWDYGKDYAEIDRSLFPEVKWSDADPTKVKLFVDKI